jgi:Zn2+/Cd2+-exporting ATPase
MRPEPQTRPGAVTEEACLVHVAANELASNRSVEAISIRGGERKISVATIGRVSDSGIAERIQESLAKVGAVLAAEQCRLLQSEPGCARCRHPLEPIRARGCTMTETGGAVTVARVRCPTVPKFWRWREFPLPKIAPRQVSLPEDEADLNEWKAQAVAAGLCAVFALAGYFTPAPPWSVPLYVASMLAGGRFAAREAFASVVSLK